MIKQVNQLQQSSRLDPFKIVNSSIGESSQYSEEHKQQNISLRPSAMPENNNYLDGVEEMSEDNEQTFNNDSLI